MEDNTQGDITELLSRWGAGDRAALDEATSVVYAELHRIAEAYLARESGSHTLQATALIHEAFLRLVKQDRPSFENRRRFFAFSARLMRQILVDHARARNASKRGGPGRVTLHEAMAYVPGQAADFLALNEALDSLAGRDERQARIIELRYFAGFNVEEAAEALEISIATVSREQRMAEAWLSRAISAPLA